MFQIQCHNNISKQGLALLPDNLYTFSDNIPDAILLRSHKLHDMTISDELKDIARAGAGTNNIPIELLTKHGIPVFNTPGANANAVKELVIACLFLVSGNICQAWQLTKHLQGENIEQKVESLKKTVFWESASR